MSTQATMPAQAPPPPIDGPGAVSLGTVGNLPPAQAAAPAGLPPGAVVTPINAQPAGLPPGAVVTPIKSQTAAPQSQTATIQAAHGAQPWLQGTLDEMDQDGGLEALTSGAIRSGIGTLVGVGKLIRKIPGVNAVAPETAADRNYEQIAQGGDGLPDEAGGVAEKGAEYLLPEGWAKAGMALGLKVSEAMGLGSSIAKLAEKYPVMAPVLRHAVEQAAAGGTQGYVDSGGNVGAAATEGLTAGAATGAIEGAASKGAAYLRNNAAIEDEVGGVRTVVPGETRVSARPTPQQVQGQQAIRQVAKKALEDNLNELNESRTAPTGPKALPARTGPYEFRLRGTGTAEVPGARQPISPTLEYQGTEQVPNPNRTPIEGPSYTQQARELGTSADTIPDSVRGQRSPARIRADQIGGEEIKPGDTRFEGPATQTRAIFKQTAPGGIQVDPTTIQGGGELRTTDPNVAADHLRNLNDVVDSPDFRDMQPEQQQQILDARRDVQKQMGEYFEQVRQSYPGYGKPMLEPVNVQKAIDQTGSLTDAANLYEQSARDGYRAFDDMTGGRASAVREQSKQAWAQYFGAAGEDAQAAAEAKIDEADRAHRELMDELQGTVSSRELDGLDDAYRNSQRLQAVAQAVDSSFSGNPNPARRSWEYYGFNGNTMLRNLNRLQRKLGPAAINRVLGGNRLDTLYQIAQNNLSGVQRKAFGAAISDIASYGLRHASALGVGGVVGHAAGIGWEAGAVAGEALNIATEKVMNKIVTNPKIAQNLIFALHAGARPQNYVPLIAGMIAADESANSATNETPSTGAKQ